MKARPLILLLTALGLLCTPLRARAANIKEAVIDFDVCWDTLAPYGAWIDTDDLGWIWQPGDVPRDWQPYTHGQWEYTDAGWLWISSFAWGWLPFHYGNWVRYGDYGWCWVPGSEWAPAWVTWYWNDFYVGWAPIPPYVEGEEIEIQPEDWVFVSISYFLREDFRFYCVSPAVIAVEVQRCYTVPWPVYLPLYCCYPPSIAGTIQLVPPVHIIEHGVHRRLVRRHVGDALARGRHAYRDGMTVEMYRPTIRDSGTRRLRREQVIPATRERRGVTPVPVRREVPAPKPQPEARPAPGPDPAPVYRETPVPKPQPQVRPAPKPEPVPVHRETPVPKPQPQMRPAPKPEPVPIRRTTPAPQPRTRITPVPVNISPQPRVEVNPAPRVQQIPTPQVIGPTPNAQPTPIIRENRSVRPR